MVVLELCQWESDGGVTAEGGFGGYLTEICNFLSRLVTFESRFQRLELLLKGSVARLNQNICLHLYIQGP